MRAVHLKWVAATVLLLAGAAQAQQMRVTILGSGTGPGPDMRRFGASILNEAGDERLLFDSGRGVTLRLNQAGVPLGQVTALFLTHLHSDHVMGIPDLYLTGWVRQRKEPLRVWGPKGTRSMMRHLVKAFEFDIRTRRDLDEGFSPEGAKAVAQDIEEGVVYERNGVRVAAFLVDHGPVKPAFGYRLDYGGGSVVLSGDTRFSENLIRYARGADVLIHEAMAPDAFRRSLARRGIPAEQGERIIAHHTTPEQAGQVFARVKPRLAVYSHAGEPEDLIGPTRKTYAGPLEVAEDLMVIEIGEDILVKRPMP